MCGPLWELNGYKHATEALAGRRAVVLGVPGARAFQVWRRRSGSQQVQGRLCREFCWKAGGVRFQCGCRELPTTVLSTGLFADWGGDSL